MYLMSTVTGVSKEYAQKISSSRGLGREEGDREFYMVLHKSKHFSDTKISLGLL